MSLDGAQAEKEDPQPCREDRGIGCLSSEPSEAPSYCWNGWEGQLNEYQRAPPT